MDHDPGRKVQHGNVFRTEILPELLLQKWNIRIVGSGTKGEIRIFIIFAVIFDQFDDAGQCLFLSALFFERFDSPFIQVKDRFDLQNLA